MSIKYIKGFDGLRGISIILVLLTHLGFCTYLQKNQIINERFLYLIAGSTGVTIFFTISGFLITLLLCNEKDTTGKINYKRFFIRRFLRLAPVLVFFYIVVALLMLFKLIPVSFGGLILSMFYLYNFAPNNLYTQVLGHTWSLAVEEQFYLIWPFVVNKLGFSKILWIAISIVFLSIFLIFLHPYLTLPLSFNNHTYPLNEVFKLDRWFFPAVGPVMIGAIIGAIKHYHSRWLNKLMNRPSFMLFAVVVLFCSPLYMSEHLLHYLFLVQALSVGLFLCLIYFHQDSFYTNILEFKILSYLGKYSYGIYVWHGLFLTTSPSGELWMQKAPQNLIFSLILAIFSYYTIEKYANRFKNKYYI